MLEVSQAVADRLGYDLAQAIAGFSTALAAHAATIGVPAPTAPDLVERIVRQHSGEFTIVAEPDVIPPPEPAPVPLMPVITIVQARIALRRAGLLDAVEAAVTAVGEEASDRWHYGNTVRRDDALVAAFAGQLGMSEAEVDQLFAAAVAL